MKRLFDNIVSLAVIIIVLLLIIPLPPFMLDFMILLNMAISLMILLVTMYIKESLDFSIFPSLLLITTLFRLALTVSSTKLILGGAGQAGAVIKAFGEFVIGNDPVVGFIIFLIILIIQFIVITKGAERVAEVAARFTLDAMPGKQMAIDADLNSGLIDEAQARERREKVSSEAEFYGAMDGATKFVKGDAIVALITAVINIVGGIIIGYMTGVPDVLNTYTIATVGDGLVSQIPALLISTATGMVVTRSASENSLSKDIIGQFSRLPIAMIITGSAMLALVLVTIFIPGFPWLFLLILGGGMLTMGIVQTRSQKAALQTAPADIPISEKPMISETEFYKNPKNIYTEIEVPPISVEFGYSLISLFDEKEGSNFDDRLINFKRKFARDMGIVVPDITFSDNIRITPNSYVIKIKDEEVASGEILPGHYLMMDSNGIFDSIDGIDTTDPAFGIPAKWIPASSAERAEILGYSVIDPQSVIITHLSDIIKKHAHEFIGRNEIEMLLDNVRAKNKSLVDDVVGNTITVAAFQKVITNLLREQIPVKDLATILETIAEYASPTGNDVDMLTEQCRGALRRTITRIYADEGVLRVIMLDMELESTIIKSVNKTAAGVYFSLDPPVVHGILLSLSENLAKLENIGASQIVMTSPIVRVYFKQLIDQYVPGLTVLSSNEIEPKIQIQALGIIKAESAA